MADRVNAARCQCSDGHFGVLRSTACQTSCQSSTPGRCRDLIGERARSPGPAASPSPRPCPLPCRRRRRGPAGPRRARWPPANPFRTASSGAPANARRRPCRSDRFRRASSIFLRTWTSAGRLRRPDGRDHSAPAECPRCCRCGGATACRPRLSTRDAYAGRRCAALAGPAQAPAPSARLTVIDDIDGDDPFYQLAPSHQTANTRIRRRLVCRGACRTPSSRGRSS